MTHTNRILQDKGAAELALLVREKDMLLTEMTLLVRAYKDELKTEKASMENMKMQASNGKFGSRPQSSKTASLASSRSSRPQSRQRPQTANAVMIRNHNEGPTERNGFSESADDARRNWEEEQEKYMGDELYKKMQNNYRNKQEK